MYEIGRVLAKNRCLWVAFHEFFDIVADGKLGHR